jgi:hypothetical protein
MNQTELLQWLIDEVRDMAVELGWLHAEHDAMRALRCGETASAEAIALAYKCSDQEHESAPVSDPVLRCVDCLYWRPVPGVSEGGRCFHPCRNSSATPATGGCEEGVPRWGDGPEYNGVRACYGCAIRWGTRADGAIQCGRTSEWHPPGWYCKDFRPYRACCDTCESWRDGECIDDDEIREFAENWEKLDGNTVPHWASCRLWRVQHSDPKCFRCVSFKPAALHSGERSGRCIRDGSTKKRGDTCEHFFCDYSITATS